MNILIKPISFVIAATVLLPSWSLRAESQGNIEWDYSVINNFSHFMITDPENAADISLTATEIYWGSSFTTDEIVAAPPLLITNEDAVTGGTFIHNNQTMPVEGGAEDALLISFLIASSIVLKEGEPSVSFLLNGYLVETTNIQPCPTISVSICDDIFALSNPGSGQLNANGWFEFNTKFSIGDAGYFLFVAIEGLVDLPEEACAAAGAGPGCIGFVSPENSSNTFGLRLRVASGDCPPSDDVPMTTKEDVIRHFHNMTPNIGDKVLEAQFVVGKIIGEREKCGMSTNEVLRDAEYMVRNYVGGLILYEERANLSWDQLYEVVFQNPAATGVYNAYKWLLRSAGFGYLAQADADRPGSSPGGFDAAVDGFSRGLRGEDFDNLYDGDRSDTNEGLTPEEPIVPINLGIEGSPDNGIFVASVDGNSMYYFDPSAASGYRYRFGEGSLPQSLVVPEQSDFDLSGAVLQIGEQRLPLSPGAEVDLVSLGYPDGAWDFKVSGLRPRHAKAQFVLGMRFIQFGYAGFGQASNLSIDGDTDTVEDAVDSCHGTNYGAVVDGTGCSIAQLVPCEAPRGSSKEWQNHGEYVSELVGTAESFWLMGLINAGEKSSIIAEGAGSSCGHLKVP